MTAPALRVELLFQPLSSFFEYFTLDDDVLGVLDGDAPLASDTVLVDVTDDVRSVSIRRGRQREIDEFGPGTCSVTLNNDARKYDPVNEDSPYYGNIEPRRMLYVTAVVDGVDYPLYRGYVQRWTVDYSQPTLPLAGIVAADALSLLARQELTPIAAAHAGDLPGARIGRVLDLDEVAFPADLRDLDDGVSTLGATTYEQAGGNAGRYLQLVAQTDQGALFASKAGVLTFVDRDAAPGDSQATFSDDGEASSIKYLTIDQDFSDDLLYNRIVVAGTTANEQTVSDSDSIDAYGVATLQRTDLLASSDTDMLDQARVLLARFGTPEMRLRQVVVDVADLADERQAELLGLDLNARVTAVRTPPGGGTPASIEQAALVNGLEWSFVASPQSMRAVVTLAAGKRAIGFVLDDDDLGVLDDDYLT